MAQSDTADSEVAGAGHPDAAARTQMQEPIARASSSKPKIDMGASMSAAADIDALLAPLRADYPLQAERTAGAPADAQARNSHDGPTLTEELRETPAPSVGTNIATASIEVGLLGSAYLCVHC